MVFDDGVNIICITQLSTTSPYTLEQHGQRRIVSFLRFRLREAFVRNGDKRNLECKEIMQTLAKAIQSVTGCAVFKMVPGFFAMQLCFP
ncbi:MAG: hypothetical protein DDT25_00935 [Chloroflexi bacterium]|nr:hypothetical protein [Chloroflexota bacterium]